MSGLQLGAPASSSGGSGHVIQDEGTPLTARAALNFTGAGVTATDDAGNNRTNVAISGAAVGFGSPSASSVADTSADGVSGNASRADHRHAREAFGAVVASAVGDASANGSAVTVSHSDHVHGRESFVAPSASAVGDTQSAGVATTIPRSDHRHAREAFGNVVNSAVADAAVNGVATTVSHSDHVHGREAFAAPSALSVGGAAVTGSAATIVHSDHVHAVTDIISRGGSILDPAGARNIVVWRAPYACTVTNVRGFRKGGTGATINSQRNGTSTHLASALSLSSASTWADGGAVQNTAYAAGDYLEIMLVTITGAVTEIDIQVDFTRP